LPKTCWFLAPANLRTAVHEAKLHESRICVAQAAPTDVHPAALQSADAQFLGIVAVKSEKPEGPASLRSLTAKSLSTKSYGP
jgi:hypothetical protein